MLLPMNEHCCLPRSPELMSRGDTALLVVDVQEKLVPAIADHAQHGVERAAADRRGKDPRPAGVGQRTVSEGLGRHGRRIGRAAGASAVEAQLQLRRLPGALFDGLRDRGIYKILVCGIEAHVCVQQTVLDLLADGWRVYVAADAVGSRFEIDYRIALGRMDSAGATLTTAEAALFEWCEVAGTPEFKQISRLARELGPGEGD